MKKGWIVYVLKCRGGALYTGITNNLAMRIRAHRGRRGSKYVAAHLPVRVVHTERLASRSLALRREIAIKQLKKPEKEELVRKDAACR